MTSSGGVFQVTSVSVLPDVVVIFFNQS